MTNEEQKTLGAEITAFLRAESPAPQDVEVVKPDRVNFKSDAEHETAHDTYVSALLKKPSLTLDEQATLQKAIGRHFRG